MCSKKLDKAQCKKILFNLGIKFGVSPRLISERMLSDQDKDDMIEGVLTIEALEAFTEVWKASGMPDYANGRGIPYEGIKKGSRSRQTLPLRETQPSCYYQPPFVCPDWKSDCHCPRGKTYRSRQPL